MKDSILGVLRHILTFGGGTLVTKGLADETSMLEAVGALATVIGFVWSVLNKLEARSAAQARGLLLAGCILPLALLQTGCSAVAPGNDPVVVNAERTTQLAYDVFDTFTLWEFQNRPALATVPQIRQTADFIRQKAPDWLATARAMTKAYKANRTEENKGNLATALAVLRAGISEAERYMSAGAQALGQ